MRNGHIRPAETVGNTQKQPGETGGNECTGGRETVWVVNPHSRERMWGITQKHVGESVENAHTRTQ